VNNPLSNQSDQAAIYEVIQEAHEAIQAALTLIDNQEDGPVTMRAVLKLIDARLNEVETEAWYLINTADRVNGLSGRLREQRDEVLRQRDLLAEFVRRHFPDPDEEPISLDDND
jgi:hypothetical protein